MIFREATINDIQQMQEIRWAVKENRLSNPCVVTDQDYEKYLLTRGNGWVCEINEVVAGFAVVDLLEHNVWALFVHPDEASKGIGKKLHRLMLDWYFAQTQQTIWLGTEPGTRAAVFYGLNGWIKVGNHGTSEWKFEMSYPQYLASLEK